MKYNKNKQKHIYIFLLAVILISGWLFWTIGIENDPPLH